MRSILITGGTGSFGQAFTKRLLGTSVGRICILSRCEVRQHEMSQQFPNDWWLPGTDGGKRRIRPFLGDVRDKERLRRAMEDVEVVVHAAALKRIEVGHYNPSEMVKTNVIGAMNVIEAAQDAGVKKVVALSTDKAYHPISPYGQSKALAESIFLAANNTRGSRGPRYSVTRYGNVWKSRGSVVPLWQSLLSLGRREIPITDPECTRFFMQMDDAIGLVLKTIEQTPTEIAIPTLAAYRLGDVADAMAIPARLLKVTGLPPYEKRHESMSDDQCSETAPRMTVEQLKVALNGSDMSATGRLQNIRRVAGAS